MEYPKLENLNSSNCTERSIEKHYPDFWKYIIENYHHSTNWTERLYWFYHNLTDFPKCPVCGERTKFINIKTGYREFCSTKCMNSSKIIQDRKKETSRKNWGVDNPMRNKYIQEKHAQTNLKKYGVKNPFSSESVKEKIKQTNLKKYGYEHHLQNKEILNKQINTNLKKYGVPHISKLNEYKKKIRKTCLERYGGVGYESDIINAKIENTNIKKYGVKNISLNEANKLLVSEKLRMRSMKNHNRLIGYTDDNKWIMSCPHENCDKCLQKQYITYAGREYDRNKANLEPCTILNPINSNMSSLEEFIKNILSDNNIDYKNNITGLIDGRKELDIYPV